MIEVANAEQQTIAVDGYLTAEYIASKEGNWANRDGKVVWVACGDDRGTDTASVAAMTDLAPDVLPINEGALSIYGQTVGIAVNVLVSGIAQYGEEFYDRAGGLSGTVDMLERFSATYNGPGSFRAAQHSAADKEASANGDGTTSFCAHGSADLGCAYSMNVGPVANLVATNDLVFETGKENIAHITGEADDAEIDALRAASAYVTERIGASYAFDRQAYTDSGMPVQILEGKPHLPANDTGFIVNLDPHSVGIAGEDYRGDIAAVTLAVRCLLKEYDLSPSLLMKSQILQASAVRAALVMHDVSGDNTADPSRIAFGVRGGSYQDSRAEISRLEQTA